ncbi:MAG TPA: hypothetical protein VNN13_06565, partial [Methylomirabilota bacterium]|nr:hypothetical protein [Methylomirabilota bacterium]
RRTAGASRRAVCSAFSLLLFLSVAQIASASHHYTDRQLEALAERVGKTFWFNPERGKTPLFSTAPAANAQSYRPSVNESFEITELTGQKTRDPYYKVRFDSGKIGYIRPETFHEELNVTILTVDPLAEKKSSDERAAEEEKKRVEWIQAQPWSPAVKEASIRKQPSLGLTTGEIKKVLGAPTRITKTRSAKTNDEHWFYLDGTVLTFQNGLLTRVEKRQK